MSSISTPSPEDLATLVRRVFAPAPEDRTLAVLCDLPDDARPDRPEWSARRRLAHSWARGLRSVAKASGFERVDLVLYRNARRNNGELPDVAAVADLDAELPASADEPSGSSLPMSEVLSTYRILIAPTELSATAPLKNLAPRHGCRAATMGGFSEAMIPALRLDWEEIDARCRDLATRLDAAEACEVVTAVAGREFRLSLDLRHRTATPSGGLIRDPGKAANLPSGETYVVPYEGEREGDRSRTAGELALELDGECMVLAIDGNRVVGVAGDGPIAARERAEFEREPAYANVAELGLGVLAAYGIEPVGEILLDEKLALHIAFGRSDHFGGATGVGDFTAPDRVVHIDRVYLPATQPNVTVPTVDLVGADGERDPLMRDGAYV